MNKLKLIFTFFVLFLVLMSCSKIQNLLPGDKLYFCERYDDKEIGEGKEFPTGDITVMLKLKEPIGASSVNLNVTDLAKNEVVNTIPFTVQSEWDYIHFDNVNFSEPGKYKVSCLKKDGTIIATNEVEIK